MFGRKKKRLQRFTSRESLTVDEIFAKYFAEANFDFCDFSQLWSLVAFHLGIPPERLRPTDRFDEELRPEEGTELIDEIEDLTVFVRVEAERRGKTLNVHEVHTVGDVLKLLVRRGAASD